MAKIKSTMDLVMEKTRNMSMTEAEKEENRREETAGRIRGLLQQYQDKAIKLSELEKQYEELKGSGGGDSAVPDAIMKEELIGRLDPAGENNAAMLDLLESMFGIDTGRFHLILKEFRDALSAAQKNRLGELKREIAARKMISGSAVVPNPAADPHWRKMSEGIRNEYDRRIKELASGIIR